MKCSEITGILKELAPEECACDWDNPGLLAGRWDREVKKIHIALDATDAVVDAAVREGAHMLLTHHPLIFKAIKKVNDGEFVADRLIKLIQADICCYAMHTNFDAAPGCMADLAAEKMGLFDCQPLEPMGEMEQDGEMVPFGIGKTGFLKETITVRKLAQKVKETFGLPYVLMYGQKLLDEKVERIAVCPGAGGSVIENALAWGAQVLVTGDISHHQGIDAAARNMAVIDGGHYGLEHIFIPYMADYLRKRLNNQVEVVEAPPDWPAVLG